MSWSIYARGATKSAALMDFFAEVQINAHTPKDGRLERMAAAAMEPCAEMPKEPWMYQISSSGHLSTNGETSYWSVAAGEAHVMQKEPT